VKTLGRLLAFLSAALGLVTLIHRSSGGLVLALMVPKLIAGALSPLAALLGAAGSLLGLVTRDTAAVCAGAAGAALNAGYIRAVTRPHDGLDRAFGPGWRQRIPPEAQARLLPQRYQPVWDNPPAARWTQDVVFGTHHETGDPLLCDVWQPPDGVPPSGLGIIYLHGSGWIVLDKDTGTRRFFACLAAQGHVVMDVAYTLAPKADMQAMLNDVRRAVAWLKAHGAELGVDPQRVVLMGGSAGGHLALLAAYTPDQPDLRTPDVGVDTSVRGVVAYYPVADLRRFHEGMVRRFGSDIMTERDRLGYAFMNLVGRWWRRAGLLPEYGRMVAGTQMLPLVLGGTPEEMPETYALYSPITHAGPGCPPTLILQGEHDMGQMGQDASRMCRTLHDAGVPAIYVEFPCTEHAFDLIFPKWNPATQSALYDAERFLALVA
jgi:acetyl esterase/lipase